MSTLPSHKRRTLLKLLATSGALAGCATGRQISSKSMGRVVVIGGGYGGATAARYLRTWNPNIEVLLVERNSDFVSCPLSNLVLAGNRGLQDITVPYSGLRLHGVHVIRDEVIAIDTARKSLRLARLENLAYDRLVVSPGVDFMYQQVPGLNNADAQQRVLQAWKAGPETVALRRQLEAMPDGGVYVISIPMVPFRCPPAPYERACLIAGYFKRAKPKSKIIILDANEEVASKKAIFSKAWNELYKGMIDYRNNSELRDIDLKTLSAKLDFDTVRADVLNVLPPMKAGSIAESAGLITANGRWCGVNWLNMESIAAPGVHVLGDATLAAPLMPKSGHIANQHGKLAASAIGAAMSGQAPDSEPMMLSVCYSFVDAKAAAHVASVHKYDAAEKTLRVVPGSAGVSAAASEEEGRYGLAWAKNIWDEMLG